MFIHLVLSHENLHILVYKTKAFRSTFKNHTLDKKYIFMKTRCYSNILVYNPNLSQTQKSIHTFIKNNINLRLVLLPINFVNALTRELNFNSLPIHEKVFSWTLYIIYISIQRIVKGDGLRLMRVSHPRVHISLDSHSKKYKLTIYTHSTTKKRC